jgi:hypothetical protein
MTNRLHPKIGDMSICHCGEAIQYRKLKPNYECWVHTMNSLKRCSRAEAMPA